MSTPILYTSKRSPPGRAVQLTAKTIGLDLQIELINVYEGDHLKDAFLKMNPQHTIPVLNDQGKILWDSHAINIYLVTKYAKDDKLYPSDPYIRAKINAALHFDSGVLFARLRFAVEPIFYNGSPDLPQDKVDFIFKAYELLEDSLISDYMVGNEITLADLSCITTISSLHGLLPCEEKIYPKIIAWIERMKKHPHYEETNKEQVQDLVSFFAFKLEDNKKNRNKSLE